MSKTKCSGEFKLSVLNNRHLNRVSYSETAEQFSIKNASTIANWQKTFDTNGFDGLNALQGRPIKKETVTWRIKNINRESSHNQS